MKNQNLKLTKCKDRKNPNNGPKSKVELKSKNGWKSRMNQSKKHTKSKMSKSARNRNYQNVIKLWKC